MNRLVATSFLLAVTVQAGKLDLSQAIREATTQGPESKILSASSDSAKMMVNEVRAVAFPKVNVFANAGLGQQPNASTAMLGPVFGSLTQTMANINRSTIDSSRGRNLAPLAGLTALQNDDPYWNYGWGVSVTQPVYTFGKVTTALNMAETQDRLTKTRLATTRLGTQQTVVELFVASILSKSKLQATQRSIERQRAVVDQLQRNFQLGSGAKAQVLLAKSILLRLTPDIQSQARDAVASRRGLNRLLGRPADDSTELDTTGLPQLEARAWPSRDEILKTALRSRGDLKILREFRGLQEDYAKVLRANNLPNILFQGKFGFSSMEQDAGTAKHLLDWDHRDWSVGLGMQWSIFDGFEQSSKAGEVRAAVRQMEVRDGDLQRLIEIDVDNAIKDRMAADSSYAAAREGVAAAAEARDWFSRNFQSGSGTLSDLLQSEENQRLAEFGLLAARLERTRTAAKLAIVQGQDLISLPEVP